MNHQLCRLVYVSRADFPQSEVRGHVDAILAASLKNNARDGVTGALLFTAGSFAQVLEGPRAVIEQTFERIQRDPRHCDAIILAVEPTDARAFSNWSMGYVGELSPERAGLAEVAVLSGFDAKRFEGDRVFELLRRAMLEEDARAA